MINTDDYITVEILAGRLGISMSTLYRWNKERIAPPYKTIKRKRMYHVPTLERWLEKQTAK